MERLVPALAVCITLIATASAFAQQAAKATNPAPPYGYYNMWDEPWGWDTGMVIRPMTLLSIIGMVALIVLLFDYGASHH